MGSQTVGEDVAISFRELLQISAAQQAQALKQLTKQQAEEQQQMLARQQAPTEQQVKEQSALAEKQAEERQKAVAQCDVKLVSYDVDSATNGASFSYVMPWLDEGNPQGMFSLHHVSRVIIPKDLGFAFLATATMPMREGEDLPENLRKGLNRILNSFAVFKTADHASQEGKG
ncbi:MAG: hypothetical protein ABI318_22480 [Chthoniobacteraceae bacterium]